MCEKEAVLVALLGASCLVAVYVVSHSGWVSHISTSVADVLGAMSFALAAVIEIDA